MAKYIVTFVMVIFASGPALCSDEPVDLKITPNYRQILVKEGTVQWLNCSASTRNSSKKLEWSRPNESNLKQLEQIYKTEKMFRRVSSLEITNFSSEDSGLYTCSLMEEGTEYGKQQITLHSVKEDKEEPIFEHEPKQEQKTATLSCNLHINQTIWSPKSIVWFKDNVAVSAAKHQRFIESNNSLLINKPTREDAGLYIARFTFEEIVTPYDCEVQFLAEPLVLDFDKSKNLIQEDNMSLHCKVKGYPRAVVTWLKNNEHLNFSNEANNRVQQNELHGYQNAELFIKNVQFEDEGEYTCIAYSKYFNASSTKTITVRVKDKLAALWPFLGIVGEVLVLCTIIFIYEKRRNKRAEQEENTAKEADGASTDKKEGLRHRNTNNPTA